MKAAPLVTIALWLAITPILGFRIRPNAYEGGRMADEAAARRRNKSAVGAILGEIRTSMADMMFVKTELYMHNGVAFLPHLDMEAMAATGEIKSENGHEDTLPPTVIPDKAHDFRGILGDLERRVKPWQGTERAHSHTSGTELLPWYRVMTLSDPHNIRGYQIGTHWLKGIRPEEALRFAQEGARNNPHAFQLHYVVGETAVKLVENSRHLDPPEPDTTVRYVGIARAACLKAAELMQEQRPHGWTYETAGQFSSWSEYEEIDARASARFAVYLERDYGEATEALRLAREYLAVFGKDGVLRRTIRNLEQAAQSTDN